MYSLAILHDNCLAVIYILILTRPHTSKALRNTRVGTAPTYASRCCSTRRTRSTRPHSLAWPIQNLHFLFRRGFFRCSMGSMFIGIEHIIYGVYRQLFVCWFYVFFDGEALAEWHVRHINGLFLLTLPQLIIDMCRCRSEDVLKV